MDQHLRTHLKVIITACLFLLVSCNSSPTVPVPPPEMWEVWPPNDEGYSVVIGQPDSAEEGDMALVTNEDLDLSEMEKVESDGSFEVEIEADIGDTIVLQILHNDSVSKKTQKEVPPED
ncbi:MAG: hypothetical protein GY847_40450 [Proteobacteria bacterium]|nr:hypothetical protein [Pseudomonadota bacterium]